MKAIGKRAISVAILVASLGACSTSPRAPIVDGAQAPPSQPRPSGPVPPAVTRASIEEATDPQRSESPAAETIEREAKTLTPAPATRALLLASGRDLASGELDAADARLERALSLAPDDPWVWHWLAQLNYAKQQPQQAQAAAQRSNSLPRASSAIKRANWALITDIETALGNAHAAAQARSELQKLELIQGD